MPEISLDHALLFRTSAGEEFGREFDVCLTAEWRPEQESFDLTHLESDGIVIAPSWDRKASAEEAALWDRCQSDLDGDQALVAKAWHAFTSIRCKPRLKT